MRFDFLDQVWLSGCRLAVPVRFHQLLSNWLHKPVYMAHFRGLTMWPAANGAWLRLDPQPVGIFRQQKHAIEVHLARLRGRALWIGKSQRVRVGLKMPAKQDIGVYTPPVLIATASLNNFFPD